MPNKAPEKRGYLAEALLYWVLLTFLIIVVTSANYERWIGTLFPPTYAVVAGRVIESKVRAGNKSLYVLYVEYKYEVNGRLYRNNRISFAPQGGSKAQVLLNLDHYRYGSSVQVYYDPSNPQFSVLEPESSFSRWEIALGILLVSINIFLVFYMLLVICRRYSRNRL